MALAQEQLQIIIDALYLAGDEFSKLQKDLGNAEKETKKTSKAMGMLKKALATMGVAAAGKALVKFAKDSVFLAARVETLGVVTARLGENIGWSEEAIRGVEEEIMEMGITTEKARQSVAMMIQAQIDLRKASELSRIAQNAAVIAGTNSSEAFQRLTTVISQGNTRMARTLGMQVNFNQAYKDFAAELGISTDALTEQQKVQARTNAIVEAGAQITGTYEAAMETAGKQLTSLPRHFDELKVAVGTEFQAEFSKGIEIVTTMLKNLKTVATSLRPVRSAIEKQTEALKEGDIVWEAYLGSLEAARMGMTQTQRQQFKMIENTEGHEQALMWLAEQLGITDLHVLKLEAGYRELGLTFEEINPEVRNFVPAIEEVGDEAEDTAFDLEALDDRLGNFLGTIETDAEKALGDMAGKLDWELLTGGSADAAMQDVQRMIQYYGELGDNQGLEQTRQDAENLAAAVLNVKVQSGEMYPSEAAVQMRDDFGLAYDDALELVTEAENLEDALTRLDEQRTLINIHWTMTGQVPDAAIELLGGGGADSTTGLNIDAVYGESDWHGGRAGGGKIPMDGLVSVGEKGFELVYNGIVIPHEASKWLVAAGLIPQKQLALGGAIGTGSIMDTVFPDESPEVLAMLKPYNIYGTGTEQTTSSTTTDTTNLAAATVVATTVESTTKSTMQAATQMVEDSAQAMSEGVDMVQSQIALDNKQTRRLLEEQTLILRQLAKGADLEAAFEVAIGRAMA